MLRSFLYLAAVLICLSLSPSSTAQSTTALTSAVRPEELQGELELVQVLFRHGDRSPTKRFPTYQYANESYWPEKWHQLTKRGKEQHFALGQYLRSRYSKFLSAAYVPSELHVRSSNIDRCIMSALCNLAGLYPPVDKVGLWNQELEWQPVPVHTMPDEDAVFRMEDVCPRFTKVYHDFLTTSEVGLKLQADYGEMYKYLEGKTGLETVGVDEVKDVWDSIFVQSQHYGHYPDWAPENSTVLLNMTYLRALEFKLNTWTPELKRLKGSPLVKYVLQNFLDKVTGANQRKVHLISAHDMTVATLLNCLGLFEGGDVISPPYAAAVIMEMRRDTSEPGSHLIELFYRNDTTREPYKLAIPGCPTPCTLTRLVEILRPIIPVDREAECGNVAEDDATGTAVAAASACILLIFVMYLVLYKTRWVRRRYRTTNRSTSESGASDGQQEKLTSL